MEKLAISESSVTENKGEMESHRALNVAKSIEHILPGPPNEAGENSESTTADTRDPEMIALLTEIRDLNRIQTNMLRDEHFKVDNPYEVEPIEEDLVPLIDNSANAHDLSVFTYNLTKEVKDHLALTLWLAFGGINLLGLDREVVEEILGSDLEKVTKILTRRHSPDEASNQPYYMHRSIFWSLWSNKDRTPRTYGVDVFIRLELEGLKDIPWPNGSEASANIGILIAKAWKAAFPSPEVIFDAKEISKHVYITPGTAQPIDISPGVFKGILTSRRLKVPVLPIYQLSRVISESLKVPGGPTQRSCNAIMAMVHVFVNAGFKRCLYDELLPVEETVLWDSVPAVPELRNVLFQYHARTFTEDFFRQKTTIKQGVPLHRVQGDLSSMNSKGGSVPFMEYRISCQLVSTVNLESPVYNISFMSDYEQCENFANNFRPLSTFFWSPQWPVIEFCPWFSGISAFQEFLSNTLAWQKSSWEKLFRGIDHALDVQLEDIMDPRRRKDLMFESNSENAFERTEIYFTVVEMLRIASEWIKDNTAEMEATRDKWNHFIRQERGEWAVSSQRQECYKVITNNWKLVLHKAKEHESELLETIRKKMEEVKSLRDGLFNATTVREATKGTHMNEYIMVFTTMTILYLPLGFVATLYGIDMFDFQMPGQTISFAVATAVVSIMTYLAAVALLFGVRRRRRIGSYRELLKTIVRPALPRWLPIKHDNEKKVPRFEESDLSKFLRKRDQLHEKSKFSFSLNEILSGSWKLRQKNNDGQDSAEVVA